MRRESYPHGCSAMNRWIPAIALFLGSVLAAGETPPAPLTSLRAIHAVSNAQAALALPVAFPATVTYFRGYEKTLFVQDGGVAIYVQATTDEKLQPGDRILVRGVTHPSFRPYILSDDITLLHHGDPPKPFPATYDELIRSQFDCMYVTLHAVVRAANILPGANVPSTSLQMMTGGGEVDAVIDNDDPKALQGLLDADVEVTGAVSGKFDGKMHTTGIMLHVSSMRNVKVLKRASANPWSLPLTQMDQVLTHYRVKDESSRIRVQGTITYYQEGIGAVLQNRSMSLWINTQTHESLQVGDIADATGFPDAHGGFLTLEDGEIKDRNLQAPIAPYLASWNTLSQARNIFDLVSIEGQVVAEVREESQDEYILETEGQLVTAIYRHSFASGASPAPPMLEVPLGSRVRVTGICIVEDNNPFDAPVPFHILMRSFGDIGVVARPSWLSVGNLIRVVSLLLLMVIAISAWVWMLRRKVHQQTAALAARIAAEAAEERRNAQLEYRRSRILEEINGSRPLAEILENITSLLSITLNGAPCWCEIKDGARLGSSAAEARGLRVASVEIPSRSGASLGTLSAGLSPQSEAMGAEAEALSVGARLATLAIETRKLYSDLRHRSEFDLLTDIHNRFSLENSLQARITAARDDASIFGLVYIDLDDFKQVNDLYGHHIGDLYLQEATLRMKRQLRTGDILARLGGDEFATLVPFPRSRADVEEIALRLERCFDQPFRLEGYEIRGSASVGIALYPEDGDSKDSLLNAADAAMYNAKHAKKEAAQAVNRLVENPHSPDEK